ncbi:MAG: hypothetical protein UZ12_BCD005001633, partial [Bacteroidetes bacterium OLB12]
SCEPLAEWLGKSNRLLHFVRNDRKSSSPGMFPIVLINKKELSEIPNIS